MNYFWANQDGRAPNNRSNHGSVLNNQFLNNYRSLGGHSRTPQDMPPRGQLHSFPSVSSRTNPHRPQIHPNFTQGMYQDPNIIEARTTQPSRMPFPTSTTNNNTMALIVAARYGRVLPLDLPSGSQFQPCNMISIDNTAAFNSLQSYGNSFNLDVVGYSFNGGIGYAPNYFSNPFRPNFATNSFPYFSRPSFATSSFPYFSRPSFATNSFPYSSSSNFHNNERNLFSYGENSVNSSVINNFINNPRTRLNMNNFYNQRSFLSLEENSNNSSRFNINFMNNPSTSVNRNNRIFGLENVMSLPTPNQVNNLELVRSPVDLARERALKHPLTLREHQETRGSKRPMINNFCEGRKKELLLFKDNDDGEKNSSSASEIATDNGGNGIGNDEGNLDLSLTLREHQETRGSKRRRINNFCEGRKKELLLFKDSDDGEKNSSSISEIATEDGGNRIGNDEGNLDLSLHL